MRVGKGKVRILCVGGGDEVDFFARDGLVGMEWKMVKNGGKLNKIKSKLNKIKDMLA